MNVVGFDFGTTNSLISAIRGGRPINFLDEEQLPIPSVVCFEGTHMVLGRPAKERLARAGLGIQGNVVRSPKMFLGHDSIHVEGMEKSPVEIVSDVVRHVLDEARGSGRLGDVDGAVVTIPVDMEGYRRRALRDAFRLAGLRIVQFVHEPLAALYGLFRGRDLAAMLRRYDRKLILVFDWGGGTLDLTLCRPMGDMVVQLMNDGTDEVGGDVFDEAIMNRLVQNVAHKRGVEAAIDTHHGARARLLDRCERAKIDLSTRARVAVYVSSFFRDSTDEDFDYTLDQTELDRIVGPLVEKGLGRVERLLADAGYSREQVSLCLATGGMSNMPVIRRRLHEWFGPERVEIPPNTATLIAEGAAWIASDGVGLQLAKNVELLLARNSYLPLVKSGTTMPREGDVQADSFHLYCTDPRDGVAKFQICSPRRAGSALNSDPRMHLENITVSVDSKARAFEERLELDVQINDDLILEAHARSLNLRDEDRCELHNLEFGLQFPVGDGEASEPWRMDPDHTGEGRAARGAISVRANVATEPDLSLVPGEFLYEYDPRYFDLRHEPPAHQDRERLYYQPCAICGRAANDPACSCASTLPTVLGN